MSCCTDLIIGKAVLFGGGGESGKSGVVVFGAFAGCFAVCDARFRFVVPCTFVLKIVVNGMFLVAGFGGSWSCLECIVFCLCGCGLLDDESIGGAIQVVLGT